MEPTEIAKDFVNLHKENNIENWQPLHVFIENEKLLIIWNYLMGGTYGEVRENDYDEYEIEIPGNQSKTGNPIIFEWEK